mgnify:CR=1 FL=1
MKTDVLIIGGGPAGLTAGIFTTRAGLSTVLIERLAIGGQASLTYLVENYPGFDKISGFDLTDRMAKQAEANGVNIEYGTVNSLDKSEHGFIVKTNDETYEADKVIIACGCKTRRLGLINEVELTGHGVSYCASCDGHFFKDKVVAIVGGGNSAITDVDYLSRLAKKIYLINRSENFRAGEHQIKRISEMQNVEILTNAQVSKLSGTNELSGIQLTQNGELIDLKVDGLFVAIGQEPYLPFLNIDIKKDSSGYILVDENMQTSEKNLFACGDIISKHFRQIITACADGAVAGNSCVGVK